MSAGSAPRLARRLLGRLLPGPLGAEALEDLDREHERLRDRCGALPAALWYASHVLRPSTWILARALRRAARRSCPVGGAPSRGPRIGVSWLDVKLGLRMLAKHPAMTAVSALAMSVTIAIAIGMFSVFQDFLLRPDVPLPEGERIVSLGMLATDRGLTYRQLLHDVDDWRALETVEEVSIWRHSVQNLVGADGRGESATFAMMSASGFGVARVPPLLGRPLLDADEVPGAPPVLVIGYDAWQRRFAGDPRVVGRTVQIGRVLSTIVGVMPEGYGFPLSEQLWLPFTDDPDDFAVMETPYGYFAFGRLAPGVTLQAARDEMAALSARRAAERPDSHGHVRSIVMPYTDTHTGMDNAGDTVLVRIMLGVFSLFVLIPFVNVAILVYARTATRTGEIAIRSSLGASRRRIVTQLFVEALVLACLAAVVGVGIVLFAMARIRAFLAGVNGLGMPFWAKNGEDPWAVAYVVALTVLAAVVSGVIPGLRATGKGAMKALQRAGSGGGMRLGPGWTGLVVLQVAITVAFLPFVASAGWQVVGFRLARPTFDAAELVAASIRADPAASVLSGPADVPEAQGAASLGRGTQAIEEVVRRVQQDPRVAGVSLSTDVPGTLFGASRLVEVEGVAAPLDAPAHRVGGVASVAADFFDVIGVEPVAGRTLARADADAETPPVVVDRTFVTRLLGGSNAVGRRLRWHRGPDEEPEPWREIVGVIDDLVANPTHPSSIEGRVYAPLDRDRLAEGVQLIVRAPGSASLFAPELRRIATSVDPTLRLGTATPLGASGGALSNLAAAGTAGLALLFSAVLLLCAAGIFSLMSFAVTRRRREIGVRSALGAQPGRVLVGVLARAARQLAIGVAIGLVVVFSLPPIDMDGILLTAEAGPIAFVALVMLAVGLLAVVGPARRGLGIEPSEALREG